MFFPIITIVCSSFSNLIVFLPEENEKHCQQRNAKAAYILQFSILECFSIIGRAMHQYDKL